jgi:hypothetical protein
MVIVDGMQHMKDPRPLVHANKEILEMGGTVA